MNRNAVYRCSVFVIVLIAAWWFVAHPAGAAPDTVEVVAEGVGVAPDGNLVKARDIALADALRNAVEQAVGTIIDAQTKVSNYGVLQDSIYTRASGYITKYQIIDSWTTDGVFHLRISAAVKQGDIINDIDALRIAIIGAGDPRVMVLIPESHVSRPVPDPAAETEIIRQLLNSGFLLVDQNTARQARDREITRRAIAGDTAAARNIASEYGADILVIGEAFSELMGNFSGLISCRARVEVRVVRADTGEILAAHAVQESGVDITEGVAAKKALAKAGASMATYLQTAIPKKLTPAEMLIEVSASGLSFTEAETLRIKLKATHLVQSAVTRDFLNGNTRIDVRTSLKPMELASEIASWSDMRLEIVGVSGAKIELQQKK